VKVEEIATLFEIKYQTDFEVLEALDVDRTRFFLRDEIVSATDIPRTTVFECLKRLKKYEIVVKERKKIGKGKGTKSSLYKINTRLISAIEYGHELAEGRVKGRGVQRRGRPRPVFLDDNSRYP